MRGLPFVFLIALIPAFIALGHDGYLFYTNYGIDNVQRDVQQQIEDKGATTFFATLGFIWTRYAPDSYKLIADSVDESTWKAINVLLNQKAFFAGIGLAFIVTLIAAILKKLGVGGEDNGSGKWNKNDPRSMSRDKTGRFKYKRK